jgi:chromosome segregation ATPase
LKHYEKLEVEKQELSKLYEKRTEENFELLRIREQKEVIITKSQFEITNLQQQLKVQKDKHILVENEVVNLNDAIIHLNDLKSVKEQEMEELNQKFEMKAKEIGNAVIELELKSKTVETLEIEKESLVNQLNQVENQIISEQEIVNAANMTIQRYFELTRLEKDNNDLKQETQNQTDRLQTQLETINNLTLEIQSKKQE